MTKVIASPAISLDGYMAGPNQTREKPFGDRMDGEPLHRWMFEEAEKHQPEINRHVDAGAFVMGRNMFGPDRGDWDLAWKGWWGDDPPYHAPVFVLAHREREPVEMEGGTTFHFVTTGIHDAVRRARGAAGDRDVLIAGGANAINQALAAGLLDELHLHLVPLIVGAGARLLEGAENIELVPIAEPHGSALVTHLSYRVASRR
jgi:dihydrofolate reductase